MIVFFHSFLKIVSVERGIFCVYIVRVVIFQVKTKKEKKRKHKESFIIMLDQQQLHMQKQLQMQESTCCFMPRSISFWCQP